MGLLSFIEKVARVQDGVVALYARRNEVWDRLRDG